MRRLVFRASAQRDIEQIALYIARESGEIRISQAFIAKLKARCTKLRKLEALLGTARPELSPDMRSTPAEGYVIFFRYTEATVEIVNILHGSRDTVQHLDPP